MLYALVDSHKTEATPHTRGVCPVCKKGVFSKCGEIYVWHWAHHNNKNCDGWYEPETAWHKAWKLIFGKDYCEIIMSKDGVRHIADIRTKNNIVIELQNSPIQMPVIRKRETFYGEKMIWIVNGTLFKENFLIYKHPLEEDEIYWQLHNPLAENYGKVDRNSFKNEYLFTWKKSRKSWMEAERPVLIDFGDEYLFQIKQGMGTERGKGSKVLKATFIEEQGGDLSLLQTVILPN